MARIFICRDTAFASLLDEVAAHFSEKRHDVIRGPTQSGGVRTYSASERAALMTDADIAVFTGRHACSAELLRECRRLRGVCFPVIGVETLDLAAADELGIIVGHGAVRGNVIGMAESNVMLMLMLLYDVQTNITLMKSGRWRRMGHHSHQLEGKTVGLIGFGRIAREVASRLAPFGVKILTHSPRARPEDLPAGVMKVGLDDVLRQSDVVSVLTGLTPETHGLIDRDKLGLMKPSAYLINTGRGAVIDEQALLEVLREKRIAGAALDTFANEPLPADSELRTLDNVIVTPHCVGHTVEGWNEFAPAMIENMERILSGRLPLYCKNPQTETAWRERLRQLEDQDGNRLQGTNS